MGYFTRLEKMIGEIVESTKLSTDKKLKILSELACHVHAAGSVETLEELASRNASNSTGTFYPMLRTDEMLPVGNPKIFELVCSRDKAHFFQSTKRINDLLAGTGIEWDGTGMNEQDSEIAKYLEAIV